MSNRLLKQITDAKRRVDWTSFTYKETEIADFFTFLIDDDPINEYFLIDDDGVNQNYLVDDE